MSAVTDVLTDIEGTTSSIDFVHRVLFPAASRALPEFLQQNADRPEVAAQLQLVAAECSVAVDDLDALLGILQSWIKQDLKHTALKALQGMIWAEGYARGDFQAHLYSEVAPALQRWHARDLRLWVYSSGSIAAQQLFFGHSEAGDLRELFSGWFDTSSGPKREPSSYQRISTAMQVPPSQILFLSDVGAELDAAASAGLRTAQLCRDASIERAPAHAQFANFDEVEQQLLS